MTNKLVGLNPQYIHELEVLRVMDRQEDRQGNFGWGACTEERPHNLTEKHPEALMLFEAEL